MLPKQTGSSLDRRLPPVICHCVRAENACLVMRSPQRPDVRYAERPSKRPQQPATSCLRCWAFQQFACRSEGLHESRKGDRKSVVKGKSVSVRVALDGRRIIKKKNK